MHFNGYATGIQFQVIRQRAELLASIAKVGRRKRERVQHKSRRSQLDVSKKKTSRPT